MIGYSHENTVT